MNEHEAGRDLDRLIAERVFGRAVIGSGGYGHDFSFADYPAVEVPRYSTDIAAAWLVVDAMEKQEFKWRLTSDDGVYRCSFRHGTRFAHQSADTAPLAACRCALLVLAAMEGGG